MRITIELKQAELVAFNQIFALHLEEQRLLGSAHEGAVKNLELREMARLVAQSLATKFTKKSIELDIKKVHKIKLVKYEAIALKFYIDDVLQDRPVSDEWTGEIIRRVYWVLDKETL